MTLRKLIVQGNAKRIGLFDNVVSNNIIVTQNTGRAIRVRDNGHPPSRDARGPDTGLLTTTSETTRLGPQAAQAVLRCSRFERLPGRRPGT